MFSCSDNILFKLFCFVVRILIYPAGISDVSKIWYNSVANKDVFSALGYGGQYIILDDSRKLVIAIASRESSSRNYRQRISNLVFNELITIFPKLGR